MLPEYNVIFGSISYPEPVSMKNLFASAVIELIVYSGDVVPDFTSTSPSEYPEGSKIR